MYLRKRQYTGLSRLHLFEEFPGFVYVRSCSNAIKMSGAYSLLLCHLSLSKPRPGEARWGPGPDKSGVTA
jgi:hypothetical protein